MAFWTNSGFEPKRVFRFRVTIADIEPFYVKQISKPKFSVEQGEHKFLNRSYFFPGHVKWEPVTAVYVDDNTSNVIQKLTATMASSNYGDIVGRSSLGPGNNFYKTIQKKALSDMTSTGIGSALLPSNPESTSAPMIIEQIDSTDLVVVEKIELYNAWVKSIEPDELKYDGEELSSYSIQIVYDWATILGPNQQ